MPMINMIAARRAESKRLERSAHLVGMAIVAVIVLAIGLYTALGIRCMVLLGDLATVRSSLAVLQPTVDRIHDLDAQRAKLEPKVILLSQAQQSTLHWRDIMLKLSDSLPEKTWLTSMNVARDNEGKAMGITLSGTSTRQALVGETMLRVGDTKGIENVKLRSTSASKVAEQPVVNFEVAASLAPLERKPK